jgi:type II secretory pathway component HofQ
VPILKDLPVLGRLFSNTNDAVSTAETVVISKAILDQQQRLERGRPIP